ncbi:UDP-glucose/GDP-mannose dehydrogenase family protein [Amycolatopsis sp. TNS106]|uniref:UDP-glucose dehydrogenase family protein n=1 Tax=Amycolatopsis sp. TNS106 TaxID=2861750 RepID=UPI001C58AA49|nr:UDP-glucose/GDP-mannose dehydrogenase family protein [Amycolatopsis sp. TNS106]QXV56944.1 UDP-glucose 6-dehydrogenase [Amycolatopsis sp. TNS106]
MVDRNIAVVGAGYVGLTTAACLASLGHRIACVDNDHDKLAALRRGEVGILEPGLSELVLEGILRRKLSFTDDLIEVSRHADIVFLCLPTPTTSSGQADVSTLQHVTGQVRAHLRSGAVVVVKSTVPVGTGDDLVIRLRRSDVEVVSNPEFLREGHAVQDFLNPDRIVVGCQNPRTAELVVGLYRSPDVTTVTTDRRTAEMAKYASNCYLAVRLSYINSIAALCESTGTDALDVAHVMGLDPRIGPAHLRPGPGWGGSCLPKDSRALLATAKAADVDFDVLDAAVRFNAAHQDRMARRILALLGDGPGRPRIGVLGLTFKAGTGDLRDSPALAIARRLGELGAEVTAFDPTVRGTPQAPLAVDDPYQAAKGAHALAVLTEWNEFQELDWHLIDQLMEGDLVVDTRNVLDPAQLGAAGLRLHAFGRRIGTERLEVKGAVDGIPVRHADDQ